MQAGVVHEINIYQLDPDASPKQQYEVGVRYLDNGVPQRALELIEEAIAKGHLNSEVRFHQLLSLLSGRTLQMLSQRDFTRLEAARDQPGFGTDDWVEGVRFIERLLRNIAAADHHPIGSDSFDKLGDIQRRKITRHLEMFLKGPLEDYAWRRAMQEAADSQLARDRAKRTWKFFEPDPAPPRRVAPEPASITIGVRASLAVAVIGSVATTLYLGSLLLQRGESLPILAYVTGILGGAVWAWNGVEWRFRNDRLRAKNREYHTLPRQHRPPPPGGFASQVDRIFRACFRKYVPAGIDRESWLAETAGIRRSIRNEVVKAYRDSPVEADAIAWLIRHRVSVVKQRWLRNTLWDYRETYRTPLSRKLAVVGAAAISTVAGARALVGAVPQEPLRASLAVLLMVVSYWVAATAGGRVVVEHRRYADEMAENDDVYARSQAAYRRWTDKLSDTPTDTEMAGWLECDRLMLMDAALRHYKMRPSNMIMHTFIEAPAPGCESARVLHGPWRFSRYRMLVFLLTTDGVRQMAADLDFLKAEFGNRQRTNYRFDAVASVRVTEGNRHERTFELALVSGYQFEIPVTGSGEERLRMGERPGTVADLTVDAAGLRNTLHILEGIAAEGKDWIAQEDQRSGERIQRLSRAVHGLVD
ncbi:hypothetical protein DMB66_32980 [Actinoplanes sp. ATCC 53533]|nr:hypothetical protein DMB66_32980 [Actinoplanes sp. ATCC 53533]